METIKAYSFIDTPDPKNIRKDIETAPLTFLKKVLSSNRYAFGVDNITRNGVYREMGYKYDFRPFLRHFVYKQYGSWYESYAINKTNLRHLVYGKIDAIIENK